MKKLFFTLVLFFISCKEEDCSHLKTYHLKLYMLGGHTRNVSVDMPEGTSFSIQTDSQGQLSLQSWPNTSCGYFYKIGVVDFDILP